MALLESRKASLDLVIEVARAGLWLLRAPLPQVPPDAVLRLETGMHTALINRIGADAAPDVVVIPGVAAWRC